VTRDSVEIKPIGILNPTVIKRKLKPGETFLLTPGMVKE
jgi:hypothetical protein